MTKEESRESLVHCHGQTTVALVAYSLPITLPIRVGLGALGADRIADAIGRFAASRVGNGDRRRVRCLSVAVLH